MRDKNRIKPILKLIEEIWEQKSDLRLGQLLYIAANKAHWHDKNDIFYLDDTQLEKGLEKMSESVIIKTQEA